MTLRPARGVARRLERAVRTLVSPAADPASWAADAARSLQTLCRARQAAVLLSCDAVREIAGGADAVAGLARSLPTTRRGGGAADDPTAAPGARRADGGVARDPADDARTLVVVAPLPGAPHSLVGVCCRFDAPLTARAAESRLELLRIVRPALEAGARLQTAGRDDAVLPLAALDALDDGVAVCTEGGAAFVANAALAEMLHVDPEAERLRHQLARSAALPPRVEPGPADEVTEVRTVCSRYRVRRRVLPGAADGRHDIVLLLVRRIDHTPLSWAVLQRRHHLTARECEVTGLLYDGRSNGEIARALGISAYTARHHTERVLRKLGVRSRAHVAAVLRRATDAADAADAAGDAGDDGPGLADVADAADAGRPVDAATLARLGARAGQPGSLLPSTEVWLDAVPALALPTSRRAGADDRRDERAG